MAEGPTLPEWSESAEGEAFDGEVNGTDISETLERVLDANACEGEPYSAWERWSEMTAAPSCRHRLLPSRRASARTSRG